MRLSKGLILAALSISSLAVAASGSAGRPGLMEDGTLTVRDGRATMFLRLKGSVIGRLGKGKLTVTASPGGGTVVIVRGADGPPRFNGQGTVYSGTNIRFRIADERRFSVRLNGKGLSFSAVGRGDGWIDGWGDPAGGIFFDGSYSLNGDEYHSLPDERARFEVKAPPPPPGGRA